MTPRLFKHDKYPKRIAICASGSFVVGGAFFLDFSRPLIVRRYLGVGPIAGAFVPVVHEGEREGTFLVDCATAERKLDLEFETPFCAQFAAWAPPE